MNVSQKCQYALRAVFELAKRRPSVTMAVVWSIYFYLHRGRSATVMAPSPGHDRGSFLHHASGTARILTRGIRCSLAGPSLRRLLLDLAARPT